MRRMIGIITDPAEECVGPVSPPRRGAVGDPV
jgi:hypothetical protein